MSPRALILCQALAKWFSDSSVQICPQRYGDLRIFQERNSRIMKWEWGSWHPPRDLSAKAPPRPLTWEASPASPILEDSRDNTQRNSVTQSLWPLTTSLLGSPFHALPYRIMKREKEGLGVLCCGC